MAMLERLFRFSENQTNARTELLAGVTTFLTMAYIIFVQPAVLSGAMFNHPTGMDFGAVTTATCFSAALATAIMALYARYPIAQAPGIPERTVASRLAVAKERLRVMLKHSYGPQAALDDGAASFAVEG